MFHVNGCKFVQLNYLYIQIVHSFNIMCEHHNSLPYYGEMHCISSRTDHGKEGWGGEESPESSMKRFGESHFVPGPEIPYP